MASGINVGGKKIVVPGGYSVIDATPTNPVGFVSGGVPCLVGSASDGRPQTVLEFTTLDGVREEYVSGDIVDAAKLVFDAGRDRRIVGGPTKLVVVKTNQDTTGSLSLSSAAGPAMTLTTKSYGDRSLRTSALVGTGTTSGISLTLGRDDYSETVDDLGGSNWMTLLYDGDYSTMLASIDATGLSASFTSTASGADTSVGTHTATKTVTVATNSAVDHGTHLKVIVYGLDASNSPIKDTITVAAASNAGTTVFEKVTGWHVLGAPRGTITVSITGGVALGTVAAVQAQDITAGVLSVTASDPADATKKVTIKGASASGQIIGETITLAATAVTTTNSYTKVLEVAPVGDLAGNLTVTDSAAANILTSSDEYGVQVNDGLVFFNDNDLPVDGTFSVANSTGSTKYIVVRGRNKAGADVAEAMQLAGTTTVTGTTEWAYVDHVEVGRADASHTLTFSGKAFNAPVSNYDNLTTLETFVDAVPGFSMTMVITDVGVQKLSDSDYASDLNAKLTAGFTSDLYETIKWINTNSVLWTAARASGGTGALSTFGAAKYASGGATATATNADYTSAFTLLEKVDVQYVCPLSNSSAVHAALDTHCRFMAGADGRSERMGYVGAAASEQMSALQTRTRSLNSQYMNMSFQEIQSRSDAGALTYYAPHFAAALQMGAQSSVTRGMPLTAKGANAVNIRQHSSINIRRDQATMINSGLSALKPHKTAGFVWLRTITTYLREDNDALQESSQHDALLASTQNVRDSLEALIVGERDVDTTPATVKKLTETILGNQQKSSLIRSFRNVSVTESGTAVLVSYEVAPVSPRNFVKTTAHVIRVTETA